MKVNTVIIGGGISGLSTANFLSKKTSDFLILEASDIVGGTINSSKLDGYILENGPNTVLDNNKAIQELLSDLSITEELIYPNFCLLYTSPSPRDGLLARMPSSA